MNKITSLSDAADLVQDGQTVTIGGTLCQRIPAAFVRELARHKVKNLRLIKSSPGYDAEILAAANCLASVRAGMTTLEAPFGMSPSFRKHAEEGTLNVIENSCPSVMGSLQAAAFGLPFMPVAGLQGSDVPKVGPFKTVRDPFSGDETFVVEAVKPDWAILHVNEADELGNARTYGTPVWDRLMSRAAGFKRVIITAEKILPTAHFVKQPELTMIPEIFVKAVVHLPGGAWPTSSYPDYDTDEAAMFEYLDAVKKGDGIEAYLQKTASRDHQTQTERIAA